MAFFQSALDGAVRAIVDAIPQSVRVSLYGAANQLLSKARGGPLLSGDHLIPSGGLADGNFRFLRLDKTGALATGDITLLLHEPFEGATVSSPNRIALTTATFVQAQTAAAGLNLNNTNLNTAAAAALLVSNKQFLRKSGSPLLFQERARLAHVANMQMELGFGQPASATVPPTVGAYWQVTTSGVVQPVWTFNGTDVPGEAVVMPSGWEGRYYQWSVLCNEEEFVFFILDPSTNQLIAERRISIVNTAPKGWNVSHLPVFNRVHNVTAPATAGTMIITRLDVYGFDLNQSFPFAAQMTLSGFDGLTNPLTFAQLANYANSTDPTPATLSNTAAGYTTPGGQFSFVPLAGAVADYALFAWTNTSPYTHVCTGIDIDTINLGAAVAGTPTVLQWFAVPDATAISLATAGLRRIGLGIQSFLVGAAIGAQAPRISSSFPLSDSPLITSPGRLLIIAVKLPVSTVTASQVIRGLVAVKGFFY